MIEYYDLKKWCVKTNVQLQTAITVITPYSFFSEDFLPFDWVMFINQFDVIKYNLFPINKYTEFLYTNELQKVNEIFQAAMHLKSHMHCA